MANKFKISDLPQLTNNSYPLSTVVQSPSDNNAYAYKIANQSSSIQNSSAEIPNSKAVHDYVNSISTSLSVDIQNGAGKLVDGKAVKDYAASISSNLSNDIANSNNVLVDGKAVHDYISSITFDSDLYGATGDVIYLNPNGIQKQTIFRSDIYICENQADEDKCTQASLTLKQVFDSWIGSGSYKGSWFGYSKDYPAKCRNTLQNILDFNKSYSKTLYDAITSSSISFKGDYSAVSGWLSNDVKAPSTIIQLTSTAPTNNWHVYDYWFTDQSGNESQTSSRSLSILNMNGDPGGYAYWVYNDVLSSILQPCNTIDWSFYTSPQRYTQFILDCELCSSARDNDYLGLVGAYAFDENQKTPMMLLFTRPRSINDKVYGLTLSDLSVSDSNNGELCVATWYAAKNTGYFGWIDATLSTLIDGRETNVLEYKHLSSDDISAVIWNDNWGDTNKQKKVRIRIQRDNNKISAWTSNFTDINSNTIPLVTDSLLSIEFKNTNSFLSNFTVENGGGSIGFCENSQAFSSYKINEFKVPITIYRTDNNAKRTITIDGHDSTTYGKFNDEIGIGRIVKNEITGKTFYIGTNNYVKIAELTQ